MRMSPIACGVALLLSTGASNAATFCVDSTLELQNALQTAGSNGEGDIIRIEQGTYAAAANPVAFAYSTNESFPLSIAGGYLFSSGTPCGAQGLRPETTVLSGSGVRRVIQLIGASGTNGNLRISNLTIANGFSTTSGAGALLGGGGFAGNVSISRVIFERNITNMIGGGLSVGVDDGGSLELINNLFLLNRCGVTNCAISATVNSVNPVPFRALIGNNTIVFNQCTTGFVCNSTGLRYGGSARVAIYNNAFAGNSEGDLRLDGAGGGLAELYHNNLVTLTGIAPAFQSGNIAFANPQFVDTLNDDFRIRYTSPLRNAGTDLFFALPTDLLNRPRVREGVIDIGAYENDEALFADQFEVVL